MVGLLYKYYYHMTAEYATQSDSVVLGELFLWRGAQERDANDQGRVLKWAGKEREGAGREKLSCVQWKQPRRGQQFNSMRLRDSHASRTYLHVIIAITVIIIIIIPW